MAPALALLATESGPRPLPKKPGVQGAWQCAPHLNCTQLRAVHIQTARMPICMRAVWVAVGFAVRVAVRGCGLTAVFAVKPAVGGAVRTFVNMRPPFRKIQIL